MRGKLHISQARINSIVREVIMEAWKGIEDVITKDDLTRQATRKGFKYIAYHNSSSDEMDFFDVRCSGIHFGSQKAADERGMDRGDLNSYTRMYFLKMDNPYVIERDFDWERDGALDFEGCAFDDPEYLYWRDQYEAEAYLEKQGFQHVVKDDDGNVLYCNDIEEMLKQKGYDCIVYKNQHEDAGSYSVAMFNPNYIKLACQTYDNQGKPIPLDKRFDTSTDDVRY